MKTRKYGKAAATAVVLILTVFLITSCLENLDMSGLLGRPPEAAAPIPTGALVISIGSVNARTILPNLTDPANGITEYRLYISNNDGDVLVSGYSPKVITDFSTEETVLDLVASEIYTVRVDAVRGVAPNDIVVATGSDANVTIPAEIEIELKASKTYAAAADTGEFTWKLTFPGGVAAAMVINPLTTNATSQVTIANALASGGEGSETLNAGEYRVILTITQARHQNRVITETLHVYKGLTSHWQPAQFAALNRNDYDILYNLNYETAPSTPAGNWLTGTKTETALHASTIAAPSDVPTRSGGYTFKQWNIAATGSTAFGWGTTKIYGDTTVYAEWNAPQAAEITINFAIPDIASVLTVSMTPDENNNTINDVLFAGIEFTLSGTVDGWVSATASNTEWWYEGAKVGEGTTFTMTDTINANFSTLGVHDYTVVIITSHGRFEKAFQYEVTANP